MNTLAIITVIVLFHIFSSFCIIIHCLNCNNLNGISYIDGSLQKVGSIVSDSYPITLEPNDYFTFNLTTATAANTNCSIVLDELNIQLFQSNSPLGYPYTLCNPKNPSNLCNNTIHSVCNSTLDGLLISNPWPINSNISIICIVPVTMGYTWNLQLYYNGNNNNQIISSDSMNIIINSLAFLSDGLSTPGGPVTRNLILASPFQYELNFIINNWPLQWSQTQTLDPRVSITYGPSYNPTLFNCTNIQVVLYENGATTLSCRTQVNIIPKDYSLALTTISGLESPLLFFSVTVSSDTFSGPGPARPLIYSVLGCSNGYNNNQINYTTDGNIIIYPPQVPNTFSCPTEGGVAMIITGENFDSSSQVSFNGVFSYTIFITNGILNAVLPPGVGANIILQVFTQNIPSPPIIGLSYSGPNMIFISSSTCTQSSPLILYNCDRSSISIAIQGFNFGLNGGVVLANSNPCENLIHNLLSPHTTLYCTIPFISDEVIELIVIVGSVPSAPASISFSRCNLNQISVEGTTVCEDCVAGKYSYNTSDCIDCPVGWFRSNNMDYCMECPLNSYSSTSGSDKCTVCSPGFESTSYGSTVCSSCFPGYYNPYYNSSCILSPINSYSQVKIIEIGSSNLLSVQGAINYSECPIGTESCSKGSSSCIYCDGIKTLCNCTTPVQYNNQCNELMNPCLNNGLCSFNLYIPYSQECDCSLTGYYGRYCENTINYCDNIHNPCKLNETCEYVLGQFNSVHCNLNTTKLNQNNNASSSSSSSTGIFGNNNINSNTSSLIVNNSMETSLGSNGIIVVPILVILLFLSIISNIWFAAQFTKQNKLHDLGTNAKVTV